MNSSFSDCYIQSKKKELALELLRLVGINDFEEKKYITFQDLQCKQNLQKMQDMIPALRTVFQISKNRCLSANSWNKSKHPGVNLYRQVLRDVGYKLSLINEFQGTMASNDIDSEAKKIYNTKYIIVPVIEDFINNDNGMIKNEENEEN